ncbi:MAG: porin [Acidobacteria bacterium]|nr:porin [Acidobacteriota bacterium]
MEALKERVAQLERIVAQLQRPAGPSEAVAVKTSGAPQTASVPETRPETMRVYWREGLRLDSADNRFRLRIGGRTHQDWAFLSGDRTLEAARGPLVNGTELRRARLRISGLIHDRVEFSAEYDFADGNANLKDSYLGLEGLPLLGDLRFGHFKEPMGLEQLTSGNYVTFLERATVNLFTPERNMGVMFRNAVLESRLTYAAGVFRETDNFGAATGDGNFNTTVRVTGLPLYANGGARLLHLGISYSHRNPFNDRLRFRERPEVRLAPRFVDTGTLVAASEDRLGTEFAAVYGPASIQGEYIQTSVNSASAGDPRFSGFYIQGSYLLTGEHRTYDPEGGAFGRVRPRNNLFGAPRGAGAWELAGRYSQLDLNDKNILGGKVQDFTLGVNWYLNPNARIMWNYLFSNLDQVGDLHAFQTRFQVDF